MNRKNAFKVFFLDIILEPVLQIVFSLFDLKEILKTNFVKKK